MAYIDRLGLLFCNDVYMDGRLHLCMVNIDGSGLQHIVLCDVLQ